MQSEGHGEGRRDWSKQCMTSSSVWILVAWTCIPRGVIHHICNILICRVSALTWVSMYKSRAVLCFSQGIDILGFSTACGRHLETVSQTFGSRVRRKGKKGPIQLTDNETNRAKIFTSFRATQSCRLCSKLNENLSTPWLFLTSSQSFRLLRRKPRKNFVWSTSHGHSSSRPRTLLSVQILVL